MTEITQVKLDEMLAAMEGVPAGPWSAHMDDFTLHVERGHFIPDNYTLALCATGDHAYKLTPYLAGCDPDTMRALIILASQALRSQGEVRDDIMCNCVGTFGPNPECGRCGGSGCYTGIAPNPAPQEAGEVKVKPLEWEKHNVDGTFWTSQVTICGEYKVKHTGKEWDAWVGMISIAKTQTCDEAKAAAFAYHVARIRSTLTEGSSR